MQDFGKGIFKVKQEQIFLSERNLRTLLSKLERQKQGDLTACTIIKYAEPDGPYKNTIDTIMVTAVQDDLFYSKRAAGEVHPIDEIGLTKVQP